MDFEIFMCFSRKAVDSRIRVLIWGLERWFEHSIFELQNCFSEFLSFWVWYDLVRILRCINPGMSCLVMHRAGGVLVWSCVKAGGMLIVLGNTTHENHCKLRSSILTIRIGIRVVEHWDNWIMFEPPDVTRCVAPCEASQLDRSGIMQEEFRVTVLSHQARVSVPAASIPLRDQST